MGYASSSHYGPNDEDADYEPQQQYRREPRADYDDPPPRGSAVAGGRRAPNASARR